MHARGMSVAVQSAMAKHMPAWLVERAIQRAVQRWVGAPMLIVATGCQFGAHEERREPIGTGGQVAFAGMSGGAAGFGGAGGAGGSAGARPVIGQYPQPQEPLPDDLSSFQPALPREALGFVPMRCKDGVLDPMPYVKPSEAFDFQAWRSAESAIEDEALSVRGVPCETASDEAACLAAQAAEPVWLNEPACISRDCSRHFITTTRGDEVKHWLLLDEQRAFLGAIDTPEEALMLVVRLGYLPGHGGGCETATIREVEGGYEIYAREPRGICGGYENIRVLLHVSESGNVFEMRRIETGFVPSCPGRMPRGLHTGAVRARDALGAFYAQSAQLEAAAVHAFGHMLRELQAFGAPAALIAGARRAQRDELRHARQMRTLAARAGAQVAPITVDAFVPRDALAMAIDNAVEGCARETWAAVLATYQAAHIPDREAAAVLERIAEDERSHAALSWQVGAWLDTQLTDGERAQVASAHSNALAALHAEVQHEVAPELVQHAGLPDARTARCMLQALEAELRA